MDHTDLVLKHLAQKPMTSDEIDALEGWDACQAGFAINTLRRSGKVRALRVGSKRVSRATRCGNPAQVWELGPGAEKFRKYHYTRPMPWPIDSMHDAIIRHVGRHADASATEIAAATGYLAHTVRPQLLYLVRNGVLGVNATMRPYRYRLAA